METIKLPRIRNHSPKARKTGIKDPLAVLASRGILEKTSARAALEPWFREVLGEDGLKRARRMTVEEIRELWKPHLKPGKKISDLVIQMRQTRES